MKAVLVLLSLVLVVGILNLLQGFGLIAGKADRASSSAQDYVYEVYTVDEIGMMIQYLINEDFLAAGESTYPAAILENPRVTLPRMMNFMSAQGWELVTIKDNGLHFFRKPVSDVPEENIAPRLKGKDPVPDEGAGSDDATAQESTPTAADGTAPE